jgi:cytochrome P450 family 142 subfamily A polypeptide 1
MEPIDLLDGEFYAGDPFAAYEWLRREAPVYWDEKNEIWGIARYADLVEISKHPETFCSGQGFRPKVAPDASMISQDDPRHTKQRRLVYKGFTPKQVAALEGHVREVVTETLDAVAPLGRCDFTQDVAVPLPMILIAEMLGIRREDRDLVQRWSDELIKGADGPEHATDAVIECFVEFCDYTIEIIADRRANPRDDLISILCHDEIDGVPLTEGEIISEALLILIGGNETTRNVISGAMEALIAHPDQRARLAADPSLLPVAVEEFVRWVTPIVNFRRTATRDVELRGQKISEGESVLLLYGSANRDEDVFDRPDLFDTARSPNPHVAFGFGTHFCLGANLARVELRVMFEEVLRRLPDMQLAPGGSVVRTPSAFIRGIASMPVEFTPRNTGA